MSAAGTVFALFTSRTGSLNGLPASTTSYLHKDHLGSVAAITTADGALAERLAYDPWGKRRHIHATPGKPDTRDAIVGVRTDRGYTEHEHLDEIGVIHMNGRIFDPLIGRFMSADAVIPDPFDLQSYNRYSYVENNPLALWDPSGHEPWSKGPDGGNTQYSSNSKGEVSNTFSGSSYSFSSSSLATKSSGVSPMSLAGLPGGGAQATSDYSKDTGKWTVTSFGKDLADSGATQKAQVGADASTQPKTDLGRVFDHGRLDVNHPENIVAATTAKPTVAQEAVSIVGDVTPGVGTAKSLVQIYTGEDLVTKEKISRPWEVVGVVLGMLPGGKLAAKGAESLWSAIKSKSAVENAFGHWQKHRSEFPELANSKQYVEAAKSLVTNPPASALTKVRGAENLVYDKATNTFAVQAANGAPKTMFRPTDGINYWNKQ